MDSYDAFTPMSVRTCMHNFCRGEVLLLEKVAAAPREDDVLPQCFESKYLLSSAEALKMNRKSFLIEKEDILEWRQWYPRVISQNRTIHPHHDWDMQVKRL